jgi:chromosome segregation ATPase
MLLVLAVTFLSRGQQSKKVGEAVDKAVAGVKNATVQEVKEHVDAVVSRPTPEVQETNTLVKQMLDNQQTSSRGWEIAVQMVQSQYEQQTQRMMVLERQNGEFKNRIDTYQSELNKLLNEQKERTRVSSENQKQIGTLTQKMKDMEDSQARIADELQKARDALADTQRELDTQRTAVARLEDELNTEREEKQRIAAERDAALKKVVELEQRVQDLERQVYDLEAKLGIQHITTIDKDLTPSDIAKIDPRKTPPPGTLKAVVPPGTPGIPPFTETLDGTTGEPIERLPQ